ncbi:hypothetical protein HanPSC8_Chr10g0412991 [Helianthus annuus]|nr:hypothetical protein HanPSC8_Chr10g0412991 [Helianthus annuus]
MFLCINLKFGFFWLMHLTGDTTGEVRAVADMHQRKAKVGKHYDAFIALPFF